MKPQRFSWIAQATLFLGLALPALAQVPVGPPDCAISNNVAIAGGVGDVPVSPPAARGYYDNRGQGCTLWFLSYRADSGLSGYTVAFESATGALTPGSFGAFAGNTLASSASFGTADSGAALFSSVSTSSTTVDIAWIRVDSSGATGSGNVYVTLMGWRTNWTQAGGGGGGGGGGCVGTAMTPCVVNLTQLDSTDLGAPANYGTSPGAVKVPGVNAFITNDVPVIPLGASTVATGQQGVTASAANLGTAAAKSVCVVADIGNTIPIYIGPTGITTSTGFPLIAGQSTCQPVANTNEIYVIASTTGAKIEWLLTN